MTNNMDSLTCRCNKTLNVDVYTAIPSCRDWVTAIFIMTLVGCPRDLRQFSICSISISFKCGLRNLSFSQNIHNLSLKSQNGMSMSNLVNSVVMLIRLQRTYDAQRYVT